MDEHPCETCQETFESRAALAEHRQQEHAHQESGETIVGQPPALER